MANRDPGFRATVAGLEDAYLREVQDFSYEDLLSAHTTMARLLTRLRRHMNTLIPVGRLPSEILSRIFILFMQLRGNRAAYSLHDASKQVVPMTPLLCFTHVCYRWRSVACDTPALWTRIDYRTRHAELKTMFVSRTQSKSLSIIVDAANFSQVLELYSTRLGRLDVIVPDGKTESLAQDLTLPRDVSMLDCLTITSDGAIPEPKTSSVLFGQPDLQLKALALCPVPSWRPENRFLDLTHLYLDWRGREQWEANRDDTHYLRSILSCTPSLQHLRVAHMDEDENASGYRASPPPSPIPLRSLRTVICLRSNMDIALHLLCLIEFPETMLVRLQHVERVVPLVASFPPPATAPHFVTRCNSALLWITDDNLALVAQDPHGSVLWIIGTVSSMDMDEDGPWDTYISGLDRLGLLPSIRTLRLYADTDADTIVGILSKMPSLESLIAVVRPVKEVGVLRSRAHCELYTALRDPTCCPQLRSLVIQAKMRKPANLRATELLEMLEARAREARPLGRLAVTRWKLSTPDDPQAAQREQDSWKDALEAMFVLARAHVQVVEWAEGEDARFYPKPGTWKQDGANAYWEISSEE